MTPRKNYVTMTNKSSTFYLLIAMVSCFIISPALACRYSVRDVGFVDLGEPAWKLAITIDNQTTDEQIQQIQKVARQTLAFSRFHVTVTKATSQSNQTQATVTRPDGQQLSLPLNWPGNQPITEQAIIQSVTPLIDSPLRKDLAQNLIQHYAIILLFEGTDNEQNKRVKKMIGRVIERINQNMKYFEKPVDLGPRLRIVTVDQQKKETWPMFGFGLATEPTEHPRVMITFGKCRRLGDILQEQTLTERAVFSSLAILGRSCECDLDRHWLYGPSAPHRWGSAERQTAINELTFDPELPLVRAEVHRIISKEALNQTGGNPLSDNNDLEEILFGYSEQSINDQPDPQLTEQVEPQSKNPPVIESRTDRIAIIDEQPVAKTGVDSVVLLTFAAIAGAVILSSVLIVLLRKTNA